MKINRLTLQNFRNFSKISLDFPGETTLIVGRNMAGKSNLLEAIYLLATGGSLRAEREREMIKEGKSHFRIDGLVESSEGKEQLEIIGQLIDSGRLQKRSRVNRISRPLSRFSGHLSAVIFTPEDLDLVTDSPSRRRRYLDLVLSQAVPNYRRTLSQFDRVRIQRNNLLGRLREGLAKSNELEYWNGEITALGPVISEARQGFFLSINDFFREKLEGLESLCLSYHESILSEGRLAEYHEREIAAGTTLIGPHRDDFSFLREIDGTSNVPTAFDGGGWSYSAYGSRGEQRLAVLNLKLAELSFMAAAKNERPILLLDDIFSELDEGHRQTVLEVLGRQQTILTTTDLNHVPEELLKKMQVVKL